MSLFGSKEKKEIERLKALMSPEQIELSNVHSQIATAKESMPNPIAIKKISYNFILH